MSERPALDGLMRELDLWAEAGREATLWWRDDDLQKPGTALDPLLEMAQESGWVPGLAVVAQGMAADALAARLAAARVEILVHGVAHANHASPQAKKCEFPSTRPVPEMIADVKAAHRRLSAAFPDSFLSAFVPPWNRIAPELVAELACVGFRGVSTFGPRKTPEDAPGLVRLNTHVDVIDWRGNRRFVGVETVAENLRLHLEARRHGHVDAAEASGLLTHHLVMVQEDWRGLAALTRALRAHGAVRLFSPSQGFEH